MSRQSQTNPPDAHELHEIDRLLRSLPRVEPSAATLARTRKAVAATRGARPRFFASLGLVAAGAAALVTVTMSGPRAPEDSGLVTPDVTGLVGPVAVAAGAKNDQGGDFSLFGGLDDTRPSPSQLEARVEGIPADGSLPLELRSVRHTPQLARAAPSAPDLLRDAASDPTRARDKLLSSLAHDAWSEGDRLLLEGFADALRDPTKVADVVWSMQLAAALRAVR